MLKFMIKKLPYLYVAQKLILIIFFNSARLLWWILCMYSLVNNSSNPQVILSNCSLSSTAEASSVNCAKNSGSFISDLSMYADWKTGFLRSFSEYAALSLLRNEHSLMKCCLVSGSAVHSLQVGLTWNWLKLLYSLAVYKSLLIIYSSVGPFCCHIYCFGLLTIYDKSCRPSENLH